MTCIHACDGRMQQTGRNIVHHAMFQRVKMRFPKPKSDVTTGNELFWFYSQEIKTQVKTKALCWQSTFTLMSGMSGRGITFSAVAQRQFPKFHFVYGL